MSARIAVKGDQGEKLIALQGVGHLVGGLRRPQHLAHLLLTISFSIQSIRLDNHTKHCRRYFVHPTFLHFIFTINLTLNLNTIMLVLTN